MTRKLNNDSSQAFRRLIAIGVAALMLPTIVLLMSLDGRKKATMGVPVYSTSPTAIDGRKQASQREIASRLEEILKIREEAYRSRDPEILREIYSVDCPCLESDTLAINELIERRRKWNGIATSINVRSLKRVSDKVWIVIAVFNSGSLRIETEGGDLVDTQPAGSDLFEFALVKPIEADQWLLGFVTVLEGVR